MSGRIIFSLVDIVSFIPGFCVWISNPSIHSSAPDSTPEIPPDQQQEYVLYYVKTRLIPVFISHLFAKSIQIRARAEFQAGQSWVRLTKWNDSNQKTRALTRLCGMWQWTVHNHQNHKDHKMTLSFSPSSQQIPGQPQPDVIIMNGDTVYIKWTFPPGYQEDSLLLSNHDQRLEGTFKNSHGPHGSISGKRLSNCRRWVHATQIPFRVSSSLYPPIKAAEGVYYN